MIIIIKNQEYKILEIAAYLKKINKTFNMIHKFLVKI